MLRGQLRKHRGEEAVGGSIEDALRPSVLAGEYPSWLRRASSIESLLSREPMSSLNDTKKTLWQVAELHFHNLCNFMNELCSLVHSDVQHTQYLPRYGQEIKVL